MDISRAITMAITISWFSRSLMNVVSIFIRLWVTISMVLLLNMNISRAISRLSRPLAISVVICLWMINLNLVVRVRPVDILVAITTMAISSLSRSLLVIMLNLISVRSMIMITVLVNIRVSMSMVITISRLSRSLVVTSITILELPGDFCDSNLCQRSNHIQAQQISCGNLHNHIPELPGDFCGNNLHLSCNHIQAQQISCHNNLQ